MHQEYVVVWEKQVLVHLAILGVFQSHYKIGSHVARITWRNKENKDLYYNQNIFLSIERKLWIKLKYGSNYQKEFKCYPRLFTTARISYSRCCTDWTLHMRNVFRWVGSGRRDTTNRRVIGFLGWACACDCSWPGTRTISDGKACSLCHRIRTLIYREGSWGGAISGQLTHRFSCKEWLRSAWASGIRNGTRTVGDGYCRRPSYGIGSIVGSNGCGWRALCN